jgi:hypothetical protein
MMNEIPTGPHLALRTTRLELFGRRDELHPEHRGRIGDRHADMRRSESTDRDSPGRRRRMDYTLPSPRGIDDRDIIPRNRCCTGRRVPLTIADGQ